MAAALSSACCADMQSDPSSRHVYIFRGLRPEAGNASSRGDLSHILLEVLETLLQFRSAHVRPPSPSQKLDLLKKRERDRCVYIYIYILILYRGIDK